MRFLQLLVLVFVWQLASFIAWAENPFNDSEVLKVLSLEDGKLDIQDGDTIWIGIHELRLIGLDAIEDDQTCNKGIQIVDCHKMSVDHLTKLVSHDDLVCHLFLDKDDKPRTSYGRLIANCYAAGRWISSAMIEDGWAVASENTDGRALKKIEENASAAGKGLHSLEFLRPKEHRRLKNTPNCSCEK